MYVPFNGISTNAATPSKQVNFDKIWQVNPLIHLDTLKFITKKGSLVNYVNEAFFIQPKSLKIFFALKKRLFSR